LSFEENMNKGAKEEKKEEKGKTRKDKGKVEVKGKMYKTSKNRP
jgi:hypothetical protein